jgi:hypothetical protein
MTGLVTAWMTEIALISYRATKKGANQGTEKVPLPLPSQYAGSFLIYGALGMLPDSAAGLAAAVGWGLVAATFLNLYIPQAPGQIGATIAKSGQTNALGNTAA